MVGFEVVVGTQIPLEDDTEMQNLPDITADEIMNTGEDDGEEDSTGLEDIEPTVSERSGFIDYLSSPIVELAIGSGETQTTISTHQGLIQAPYFRGEVDRFTADAPRSIELPNYDIDACAAVLEYIYEGDYFPTVSGNTMEYDPTIPSPEDHSVLTLIKDKVTVFKAQLRNLTMRSL